VEGSSSSSGLRFVSRHDPSLLLCPDCFGSGKFPPLAVADDFMRVTPSTGRYAHPSVASPPVITGSAGQLTAAASSSSSSQPTAGAASAASSSLSSSSSSASDWTPEETLRLLEALARYGDDDWDAVQEAVGGSRTVEDCCQHFLSLPIEDPFLDQYPHVTSSAAAADSQQPDSAAPAPIPFADAGNPILAQVAFLASTVSPAVAAAAAQAAILAFSKQQQAGSDSNGHQTEQQVSARAAAATQQAAKQLDHNLMASHRSYLSLCCPVVSAAQPAADGASGSAASSSHASWSEQLLSQPQQTGSQASPAVSAAAATASQPLPVSSIPVVSAICLSAAAVKARELCLDEERKLLRCVAQLVQVQMRKVEIKLNHLTELDTFLAAKQQDVRAFHQRALQRQQTLLMQQSRQQQQQNDAANTNMAPAATDTAQLSAAVST
jgi:SWI/SNF related-matrix-associated actin-dependent regulator of chromatin subfamily C